MIFILLSIYFKLSVFSSTRNTMPNIKLPSAIAYDAPQKHVGGLDLSRGVASCY